MDGQISAAIPARPVQGVASLRRVAVAHPLVCLLPFLALFLAIPLLAPDNASLYDDEAGYLGLARHLVHGSYLTGRDDLVGGGPEYPNLWFGPGLPLVLAPFVAAHVPVEAIRLLGPLFLFGALLVFFRLLRLYVPPGRALAGAVAFGLYAPFWTVIAFLHSDALALLLVVSGLYATVRHLREGRRTHLLLAAGSFAGLALTRVAFGWVLTVLLACAAVAWLWRRRVEQRRLAVVYALALALCIPWLAYTHSVGGNVYEWGSSGALSLYWISSPYAGDRGDWHGADSVFADPRLAPHRPFFRSLAGLGLAEQNRRLTHRALANIGHHPLKFARNVADNLARMWLNVRYSFKPVEASAALYALPNLLVLAGLLLTLVRRRLPVGAEAGALVLFATAAFALHALLASYPRLLLPVIPVALWLVVAGRRREPAEAPGA